IPRKSPPCHPCQSGHAATPSAWPAHPPDRRNESPRRATAAARPARPHPPTRSTPETPPAPTHHPYETARKSKQPDPTAAETPRPRPDRHRPQHSADRRRCIHRAGTPAAAAQHWSPRQTPTRYTTPPPPAPTNRNTTPPPPHRHHNHEP